MEKSKPRTLAVHLCGYGFEDPAQLRGKLHFHPFWQLNLVCGGWTYFESSSKRYRLEAGDAVLTPPGAKHRLLPEKESGFCDYSFKFFPGEEFDEVPENIIVSEPEVRQRQLVWINSLGDIFKSIAPPELILKPIEFPLDASTPGLELLEGLLSGFCRRLCAGKNSGNSWILRKLKLFVQSRKGNPVSVKECASHLNCSEGHLLKLIRSETGRSTKEVIDLERIKIIRQMLIFSNAPISRIAENTGFNDIIYFERFFRKYTNETPSSCRKRSVF